MLGMRVDVSPARPGWRGPSTKCFIWQKSTSEAPGPQFFCNICVLAHGWLISWGLRQADSKIETRRAGMLTPFNLTSPVTDDSGKATSLRNRKADQGLSPATSDPLRPSAQANTSSIQKLGPVCFPFVAISI